MMAVEGISIENDRPTRPEDFILTLTPTLTLTLTLTLTPEDFILSRKLEQEKEAVRAIVNETGEYPEGWVPGPHGDPVPVTDYQGGMVGGGGEGAQRAGPGYGHRLNFGESAGSSRSPRSEEQELYMSPQSS